MVLYLVASVLLDHAATSFETSPGVTPWHPSAGVSLALLLACGLRYAPAVLVAGLMSGSWTWGPTHPVLVLALALIKTTAYAGAAAILRSSIRIDPQLSHLRDIGGFVVVALTTPVAVAVPSVLGFTLVGVVPWGDYLDVVLNFWLGDAIGLVVVAPLVLVWGVPCRSAVLHALDRPRGTTAVPSWRWPAGPALLEAGVQALSIVAILWVAFGPSGANSFHLFYLCFLPLIWVALRHGLRGATAATAVINAGGLLAVWPFGSTVLGLADLQLFMLVVALAGLTLGAVLTERKETQDQLQRQREALFESDKLAALGTLAAGIAHEINNPLGIISSRIEIMIMEAEASNPDPALFDDLRVIHRQAARASKIASSLLSLARRGSGREEIVDLNAVVEEVLSLAAKKYAQDGVLLRAQLERDLPRVRGDVTRLQQAILNLVTNARDAVGRGGEIHIETRRCPDTPPRVQVTVADTGAGIGPEALTKIFELFYTTKPGGTGLGLTITQDIVRDHRGTIAVDSSPGAGTRFVIAFPAVSARATPEVGPPTDGLRQAR